MRKIGRLYQKLYAFSKRTGSTTALQRTPSSEAREVGEPVEGLLIEKLMLSFKEPTSGLEPLTCSLRVSCSTC
jgi:hypothetical protein